MNSILLAAGACILSYLSVFAIRRWTERHRILDIPNERSSHVRPTPRGGGLGIVGVTLGGVLLYTFLNPTVSMPGLAAYLAGAGLIATTGWIDDVRTLPAGVRFLAQGVGALLAIGGIGYVHSVTLPLMGSLDLQWLGLPLTWLWIVGLTNAFNFMDGIDGLLGSQAVLAGAGWAASGWLSGEPLVMTLGLLVAAGSLGFLAHNWPPARIFMGDVGSTFLGYMLAVISLLAVGRNPALASAALLLVWPLLFDTAYTLLRRLRTGANILAAHRSHLYQRLVIAGDSHATVNGVYAALALAGIILAILSELSAQWPGVVWIFGVPVLCFVLWRLVVRRERKQRPALDKATLAGYNGER